MHSLITIPAVDGRTDEHRNRRTELPQQRFWS